MRNSLCRLLGEAYLEEGTVLNLSVSGCVVHSRNRVQPGACLEMRMLVPDIIAPLRIGLAKVRWSEGRRFGDEFIEMPSEEQVRLGRIVRHEVSLLRGHLDLACGMGHIS